MQGRVRSFLAVKSYGFIDGDDGESYFFHLDDVRSPRPPVPRQEVTFRPTATPKGLRARSVILGTSPQLVYVDPDRFIMTREPEIRGHIVVKVVAEDCWYESNDLNQARDGLKQFGQEWGANAIVDLTLKKYTALEGCSNYRYTMHRFYGNAVIVKRTHYTTDPDLIARSEAEMKQVRDRSTYYFSGGRRSMTRPPAWKLMPALAWSIMRTAAAISGLLVVRLIRAVFQKADATEAKSF